MELFQQGWQGRQPGHADSAEDMGCCTAEMSGYAEMTENTGMKVA
ncbi:MAG: hypothetical protein R6U68_03170 [Desulfobacteraceae bacterium]